MKKLLIIVLIILLLVLGYFTAVKGLQIGSFKILGINGIKEANDDIDAKIESASKLTGVDLPKQITTINESAKQLEKVRQDYEDLTKYSSAANGEQGIERKSYEIEYLYKQLGTYAKKEGLVIDLNIATAATPTTDDGRKLFNIGFTAKGPYIGIALFISEIENDSNLEFKIENFKMSEVKEELQATFAVKNIPINIATMSTQAPTEGQDNENAMTNTLTNPLIKNVGNNVAENTNTPPEGADDIFSR